MHEVFSTFAQLLDRCQLTTQFPCTSMIPHYYSIADSFERRTIVFKLTTSNIILEMIFSPFRLFSSILAGCLTGL
jgi:hypothetical protein